MACALHPEVETGLERCERCGQAFCGDCFVVLRDRPWCAACKTELVRDLRSGIVPGELDLATIGRRFLALWVDGFITGIGSYVFVIPVVFFAAMLGSAGEGDGSGWLLLVLMGVMYAGMLGLPVVYEGLMLKHKSQTLGKMALRVEVVTPEGGRISSRQAWGRAALKLVLGTCMGLDYVPAFFTRERTCLHDMIAHTRVVRRP